MGGRPNPKTKKSKVCVCGKIRHISRGAAEAQIRSLLKKEEMGFGRPDAAKRPVFRAHRSRVCEKYYIDGKEVWHAGHR